MPRKHRTNPTPMPEFSNGEEFDALSDEEKERVWQDCDRVIPQSETHPMTPEERARWKRIQARLRRGKP